MDGDSRTKKNINTTKTENGDTMSISRQLLSASWVRHSNKDAYGYWDSILDYNVYFLPCVSVFLWTVFFLISI